MNSDLKAQLRELNITAAKVWPFVRRWRGEAVGQGHEVTRGGSGAQVSESGCGSPLCS